MKLGPALLPVLFNVACTGPTTTTDDAPPEGCPRDPRAETYAPWMEAESEAGTFTLILDRATPAPPGRGDNEWSLRFLDTGGQPLAVESARMKPWMPDHGHGTNPLWNEVVSGSSTRHRVGPFDLFMSGLWEFTVEVTHGGTTDEAKLAFCIDRPSSSGPDGGIASTDGGTEPIECNVTAPTECRDADITYEDVEPIITDRCVVCHDGSQEQWPLTSYEHVADWYAEVRGMMLNCTMPPQGSGVEMTLAEREKILDWIRCGYRP